jgi:hypothetical protein
MVCTVARHPAVKDQRLTTRGTSHLAVALGLRKRSDRSGASRTAAVTATVGDRVEKVVALEHLAEDGTGPLRPGPGTSVGFVQRGKSAQRCERVSFGLPNPRFVLAAVKGDVPAPATIKNPNGKLLLSISPWSKSFASRRSSSEESGFAARVCLPTDASATSGYCRPGARRGKLGDA